MANKIVRVVEPPALETVGEHGLGVPVLFEPDHPPRPMLADKETSLGVEGETIRTWLSKIGIRGNSPARLEKNLRTGGTGRPPVEDVGRDIGEKQKAILPDGPFTPGEPFADLFDASIGSEQQVQSRVEALNEIGRGTLPVLARG
jgi:hypothetical protein